MVTKVSASPGGPPQAYGVCGGLRAGLNMATWTWSRAPHIWLAWVSVSGQALPGPGPDHWAKRPDWAVQLGYPVLAMSR